MDNKKKSQEAPTATSSENDIPTFTPPEDSTPTFTPPGDDIPTFTPPKNNIPTFTPPKEAQSNAARCYYHNDEVAVGRCVRCGKNLCKDCCDTYGFSSGQYAGHTLCYDCTQAIVQEDIAQLQANYKTIKLQYILTLIGVAIGAFVGLGAGISDGLGIGETLLIMLIFAAVGGCFYTFIRNYISTLPSWFTSTGNIVLSVAIFMLKACVYLLIEYVRAIFTTGSKLYRFITYMKRTEHIIENSQADLQRLKDYMEYTLVRSRNQGVDLDSLMKEGSELYNNSFAQMVQEQGEEQAERAASGWVATIAENGEIIRSFAA